ncbi:MAG: Kdo hydroxylase family protein [Planctomycetia bacterium]|nr:Kdo hydroxylase family protein [Planctomycetia bacterium]
MIPHDGTPPGGRLDSTGPGLARRLERHELAYFPVCPFPIPTGEDREFLCRQQLGRLSHKNISYDPHTGRVGGCALRTRGENQRLRELLTAFSKEVTGWLTRALPNYAHAWELDRVSFRPEEEATRQLRLTARNDLLHIDAFPTRPTNGRRILRCFVNLNPSEPRIWAVSDPFPELLRQFRHRPDFPRQVSVPWLSRIGDGIRQWFTARTVTRSPYDVFMERFHDYLKSNDEFQERCPKRYWTFAPGSAWLAFTDSVSHAVLRGRYALEHSYFVPTHVLFLPAAAPMAYFRNLTEPMPLRRAA